MDYNELIKKEVFEFLNERMVLSDERFEFKQKLTNSQFYNYSSFTSDFDVEIFENEITINWNLKFWVNEMGIENIIVDVENLEGFYFIHFYNKQTDELEQENKKNINEINWKFQINDFQISNNKPMYINKLEFDFKNGMCYVNF